MILSTNGQAQTGVFGPLGLVDWAQGSGLANAFTLEREPDRFDSEHQLEITDGWAAPDSDCWLGTGSRAGERVYIIL